MSTDALLEVTDLNVWFGRSHHHVLRDVSFTIGRGQRLGLIGESGSGKSVTALALMGLLADNATVAGSIVLDGRELVGMADRDLAPLRGQALSMVFQEPMTSLDPTMTVGRQIAEVLRLHQRTPAGTARDRVLAIMAEVGLADARRVADSFPHQLSGGQRQRVVLAMALVNNPGLVLCDEPTTALDVTVQATVLTLLNDELARTGAACLFISHDLAVVAQVCPEVMVMLDGRVVETGPTRQVFTAPTHPYTAGLVASSRLDLVAPGERLPTIEDYWSPETAP